MRRCGSGPPCHPKLPPQCPTTCSRQLTLTAPCPRWACPGQSWATAARWCLACEPTPSPLLQPPCRLQAAPLTSATLRWACREPGCPCPCCAACEACAADHAAQGPPPWAPEHAPHSQLHTASGASSGSCCAVWCGWLKPCTLEAGQIQPGQRDVSVARPGCHSTGCTQHLSASWWYSGTPAHPEAAPAAAPAPAAAAAGIGPARWRCVLAGHAAAGERLPCTALP